MLTERVDGSSSSGIATVLEGLVEVLPRPGVESAAPVAPGADECWQARDRAVKVRAVGVVLHPDEDADRGGPGRRIRSRDANDLVGLQAGEHGGPRRGIVAQTLSKLVEADRVPA